MKNKLKKLKGFTLIEMVVVVAIIALLILLIAPNLMKHKDQAQTQSDRAFQTTLQTQLALYETEHNEKATTWNQLAEDKYLSPNQVKKAGNYEIAKIREGNFQDNEQK